MLSIQSTPKFQSINSQRLLLIVVGGLFPLGFSPIDIWPLSVVSLILFINEIVQKLTNENRNKIETDKKQKKLSLFAIGLYWGIGAFGIGISWVYVSIHEHGHVPAIGAVVISFLLVLYLAFLKALGALAIGKIVRRLGTNLLILIIPFVWLITDFIQTVFLSGFPWLFAGYSQIDGPLWMLSTWVGVYGVTWFMVAMSCCVVILIRSYYKKTSTSQSPYTPKAYFLILALLISVPSLAFFTPTAEIQTEKKSINVALVQPNIAQAKKWDRRFFSQIVDILYQQSEAAWNTELLVWPEGAIPAYKHQVEDIVNDLDQRANKTNTDVMLGLPVYQFDERTSYAAFVSLGAYPQTYHKQVLVPFGEYVPFNKQLRGLMKFLNLPMSNFSPATSEQKSFDFKNYQVVPAICYEIAYPGIVHRLMVQADKNSDKAKLLVTVSNDAWIGDSFGPYQHMQMARMRALELGIPLVRSTNDGITAVVDARGNSIKQLDRYTQDTLKFEVPLTGYQTLFRRLGFLGVYILMGASLVVFIVGFVRLRKENN